MKNAVGQLSRKVVNAQSEIQTVKKGLNSKASKEEAKSNLLEAELRIEQRIAGLTKDFSLAKIDKIKFFALLTLAAVSAVIGAFWHFRAEIKSDNAELRGMVLTMHKNMIEKQAVTDMQLANLAVQTSQANNKLSGVSAQIANIYTEPNLAGP